MVKTKTGTTHIDEIELSEYLAGGLSAPRRDEIAEHLSTCEECLEKSVLAHESVSEFESANKTGGRGVKDMLKKINIYLCLAIAAFMLSFAIPRYFLQFLVATIVLGAKWVVDSKTTRLLVTVHEALKRGDEQEASRILEPLEKQKNQRF